MCKGDLALLYHSNCNAIGIAGIMTIARAGYTDYTAFDPDSNRYDATNFRDNPRWNIVDVRYKRTLKHIISLVELRAQSELKDMVRLHKGNRLSVIPVTNQQWDFILTLE
jgi:predicted RNA-binding protein with PUA-like domain